MGMCLARCYATTGAAGRRTQIKPASLSQLLSRPEVAEHLVQIFRNVTRRTTWALKWPDGDELECALDAGRIESGERNTEIAELELEIKRGTSTHLFELALALHADIPLRMSNDSKAARGFAMLEQNRRMRSRRGKSTWTGARRWKTRSS